MILSVEPLEALRYLDFLRPGGKVVTSSTPYINIPDYPAREELLAELQSIPGSVIVDSEKLAKESGSNRTQNTVMLGAASKDLILAEESLREDIRVLFTPRGEVILEANLKAFELGRRAAG